MTPTLLLFDIDGTLLLTGGAGMRAMAAAGTKLFGIPFQLDGYNPDGMLDPIIYRDLTARYNIPDAPRHHEAFRDLYFQELHAELARADGQVRLMPGIAQTLVKIRERQQRHGDVQLGLLSGNYTAAAPIKLAAVGLEPSWFSITALGDEADHRADLALLAMQKYQVQWQIKPDPRRVIVIGDTPIDVNCAKAHGCVSFGVATGRYSTDDLQAAGADVVVSDLCDPTPLFNLLD